MMAHSLIMLSVKILVFTGIPTREYCLKIRHMELDIIFLRALIVFPAIIGN